jgi:hypothetical protein
MDKFWDAIAGNIIAIAAFMVPIGIVAVTSYFKHKHLELVHQERMAAIARGIMPPGQLTDPQQEPEKEEGGKPAPNYLRRGLFWLCPGAGLVAFSLVFLADVSAGIRLPILGVSIACAGVGAAFVVIYLVEQDRAPGPAMGRRQ